MPPASLLLMSCILSQQSYSAPSTVCTYLSLVDCTSDDVPLAGSLPLIDAVICSDVPDAIRVDLTGGG